MHGDAQCGWRSCRICTGNIIYLTPTRFHHRIGGTFCLCICGEPFCGYLRTSQSISGMQLQGSVWALVSSSWDKATRREECNCAIFWKVIIFQFVFIRDLFEMNYMNKSISSEAVVSSKTNWDKSHIFKTFDAHTKPGSFVGNDSLPAPFDSNLIPNR